MPRVIPALVQDLAFPFVLLHVVPDGLFLQHVQVAVDDSKTLLSDSVPSPGLSIFCWGTPLVTYL